MKYGLCTISNGDAPVTTVVDAAASAGYDGVEIWGKEPHVGDKTATECETIVAAAREGSLELPVYGSYLRAGADGFETAFATELTVAERLGVDLIRVWVGVEEYGDHAAAHWQKTVSDLSVLADEARARDLGVTVEKHAGTLTNRAAGAERLVDDVGRPNFGLNYQPMFSLAADKIEAEARALAPLSNNVHVQAVPERGGDDRCLLEDAFFDVEGLLSIFDAAGFDGYANVEFVTDDYGYERAIERDLAYLQSRSG